MVTQASTRPSYSLRQLVSYALKLGSLGFGGPVALVGYMHRDLVEGRKWITEADYREGLTLAQLAPGPLAAQLAIYSRVRRLPDSRSHPGRDRLRAAVVRHGRRPGLGVSTVPGPRLD